MLSVVEHQIHTGGVVGDLSSGDINGVALKNNGTNRGRAQNLHMKVTVATGIGKGFLAQGHKPRIVNGAVLEIAEEPE